MVRARHCSSAGQVLSNVGGVKCQPFLKRSNYAKNVLEWNHALWLLYSIKSSFYCVATVAKLSLYSTCTRSAAGFDFAKK